jgi:hypothetical protein
MTRWRRRQVGWWLRLGGLLRGRSKVRATDADYTRFDIPHQTRFLGVRVNERLRDRLRPAWLRLRK